MEKCRSRHPTWGVRLYRTHSGLRLLTTHALFDPVADETQSQFAALNADPLYTRLCKAQASFGPAHSETLAMWAVAGGHLLATRHGRLAKPIRRLAGSIHSQADEICHLPAFGHAGKCRCASRSGSDRGSPRPYRPLPRAVAPGMTSRVRRVTLDASGAARHGIRACSFAYLDSSARKPTRCEESAP